MSWIDVVKSTSTGLLRCKPCSIVARQSFFPLLSTLIPEFPPGGLDHGLGNFMVGESVMFSTQQEALALTTTASCTHMANPSSSNMVGSHATVVSVFELEHNQTLT